MTPTNTPDSSRKSATSGPSGGGSDSTRGELLARAIRYCLAVVVGYCLGLAAGSMVDAGSPGWWAIAGVGLLALVLVFRRGVASQSHAAMDAVLEARATASAFASAQSHTSQVVQVAGGHVVAPSASADLDPAFVAMVARAIASVQDPSPHSPPVLSSPPPFVNVVRALDDRLSVVDRHDSSSDLPF